jgi:hypothetical protein
MIDENGERVVIPILAGAVAARGDAPAARQLDKAGEGIAGARCPGLAGPEHAR